MSLLLEIARCPNVELCLSTPRPDHPCAEIVHSQPLPQAGFHVPEPWSGDLQRAPILFLGSNPSFAEREEYPLWTWDDGDIADFFMHRFHDGSRLWVKDALHILLSNGSHDQGWVRYWAAMRRRAVELLQRDDVRPGIDYVMSEVVHCKSRGETGVGEAVNECKQRYLQKTIEESGASVIVSIGQFAADTVCGQFNIPGKKKLFGPRDVGGRPRYFAFLPHANARMKRTFRDCVSNEELRLLRQILK